MKNLILILILSLTCFSLFSQENNGELTVVLKGFRTNKGEVRVALFNSVQGFPEKRKLAFRMQVVKIADKKAVAVFTNIPYGKYAVGIFHDENANGKMDFGLFSIPVEGYGASNDAIGFFGPPSFKDAAFELLQEKLEISITVKY